MNTKYIVYPALVAVFVLSAFALEVRFSFLPNATSTQNAPSDYPHPITLDGNTIHTALADTPEERAQGLGGRTGLDENEGMLFVFPQDGKYAFWMKDMQFSIDILWLSSDGRVIYIVEGLAPSSYPHNVVSTTPARYVLELPAGYVELHQVKVGDLVSL